MPNVAVLTYEFVTTKPANIPDEWPAEVRELGEGTTLPGEDWVLMTTAELVSHKATHQSAFNTWLASYVDLVPHTERLISEAKAFADKVLVEFAAENVRLGITQAGMTGTVLTKMDPVLKAMLTGSLYEGIARVKAIPSSDFDATFITGARLRTFVNKIEAYLGITLSTQWW